MRYEDLFRTETIGADLVYIRLFEIDNSAIDQQSPRTITEKDGKLSDPIIREAASNTVDGNFSDGMELCTKALCLARLASTDFLLAYRYRSECFLGLKMYKKCLDDIELARNVSQEEPLKHLEMLDLEQFQVKCYAELRKNLVNGISEETESRLTYEADANYPCMANVLELRYNEEFGYHIIAKCDIDVGQKIVIEKSFTSVTTVANLVACFTCQRTQMNFIPCDDCVEVVFCDDNCKERNKLHPFICGIPLENFPKNQLLIMQSISIAVNTFENLDPLINFVQDSVDSPILPLSLGNTKSNYKFFLKLYSGKTNEISQDSFQSAQLAFTELRKLTFIQKLFCSEIEQRFLMHLVMLHTLIIEYNAFGVTQKSGQRTETVCAISSLFNHSCAPNVLRIGDSIQTLITMRPIKKGEQLFISYSDIEDGASRLSHLESQYGFRCKCDKCVPKSIPKKKIIKDSNYRFVMKKMEKQKHYENDEKRKVLMRKCKKLLNSYGHLPWCEELDAVMKTYTKCILWSQ